MQVKYICVLALWLMAISLQGQITISADDFRNPVGDALERVDIGVLFFDGTYFIPPSGGENQQWDYRWLQQQQISSDLLPEIDNPVYPEANTVLTAIDRANLSPFFPLPVQFFQRYDDDGLATVGEALPGPVTLAFPCEGCLTDSVQYQSRSISAEAPVTNLQLPLDFGDSWSSSFVRQTSGQLQLPTLGLEGLTAEAMDSVQQNGEVIGWGNLTLPNNTISGFIDLDVLLVRETITRKTNYTVDGAPAPQAFLDSLGAAQGESETLVYFHFYTPGLGQPALTIAFFDNGEFLTVRMAASLSEVNPEEEGTYTTVPITHDGLNRSYDIYVPPSYTGEEAVPVVMTLHGYTGTSKLTAWQTRMNEVADTAGFIVVYPQGQLVTQPIPPPGLPPTAPGWNTPGFVSTTDDVGFLLSVLEDVTGAYNIDEAAAYLCGISNGAGMTDIMSGAAPERFAAVGEVASVAITPRDHLVPTMIVRGTDDPLVPYDGFPQIGIPSTEQAVAHYGRLNGCALTPDSLDLEDIDPADNTTVTRFTYTDCYGNADLVFYRVNGGSHVWDDGPPAPILFHPVVGPNVNRDFSVSATMWNFFKQHRLPHARLLSQTLEDQDSTRNYLLYVPAAYDGTEEWPLVLNLHGGFNDRFVQMWNSRMNLVADTAQFLVAYPEGHLQEDGRVWNTQEQPTLPDDVAYLSRLIDTLTANYAINPARIYSSGFSMGGEMSYLLGCNIPDQVAAIASVSGTTLTDNDWTCTAGQPLPLLHMHGTADIVAPIEGGTGVPNGFDFPAVRGQLDFWINSNSCAADSTVTQLPDTDPNDNSTITLTRFDDCALYQGADGSDRTAEVWYYRVEGGGHSWPDGRFDFLPPEFQPLFSPVNRDINASSEIWNFFNRHRLLLTNTDVVTPVTYAVEVFPNPAQEAFQLSFVLPAAALVQVQLFNAVGQVVHQQRLGTLAAGQQQVQINQLGALPAGLYYYRLQVGAGQVSGSVMISQKP